jgi:hypothetical protein
MSQARKPIPILPSFSRMLRLTRPNREDAVAFIILSGWPCWCSARPKGRWRRSPACISNR